MTPQEKYDAIVNAYTTISVPSPETERIIISDKTPEEVRDFLVKAQHDVVDIFNLSYTIADSAASILSEIEQEDVFDYQGYDMGGDLDEACSDVASVYTSERLSWLCVANESEISDLMSELEIKSISDACAVWYDQKVRQMIEKFIDYINQD
jgi:hypothetical protein